MYSDLCWYRPRASNYLVLPHDPQLSTLVDMTIANSSWELLLGSVSNESNPPPYTYTCVMVIKNSSLLINEIRIIYATSIMFIIRDIRLGSSKCDE